MMDKMMDDDKCMMCKECNHKCMCDKDSMMDKSCKCDCAENCKTCKCM